MWRQIEIGNIIPTAVDKYITNLKTLLPLTELTAVKNKFEKIYNLKTNAIDGFRSLEEEISEERYYHISESFYNLGMLISGPTRYGRTKLLMEGYEEVNANKDVYFSHFEDRVLSYVYEKIEKELIVNQEQK